MFFRDAMTTEKTTGLPQGLTTTWNGALSYQSMPKDCHLEFFSKVLARVKGASTSDKDIENVFSRCWSHNPQLSLRLLMQKRDCRAGAGERHVTEVCMDWLARNHPAQALANMENLVFYGRWKDVLDCFMTTPLADQALEFVAKRLVQDLKMYQEVTQIKAQVEALEDSDESPQADQMRKEAKALLGRISLCAKWAPTEGGALDRKLRKQGTHTATARLAKLVWSLSRGEADPKPPHSSLMRHYRQVLSQIREATGVLERLLCARQWSEIDFSRIPSRALHIYAQKCFPARAGERFRAWQQDVLSGKAKVNTSQVDPYEIVYNMLYKPTDKSQLDMYEAFYRKQIEELSQRGDLMNTLVMADVSGSMAGTPMSVSIAMAIWLSSLAKPAFRHLFMTFDDRPAFVDISTCTSLAQMVNTTKSAPWGGSTNLQGAFELLLGRALKHRIPADQMPQRLVIVSDMQFNMACRGCSSERQLYTNYETARARYRNAGYQMPELVFWNVNGSTQDMPVQSDTKGVMFMGGFSKNLINLLLMNQPIKTPQEQMLMALSDQRYDRICWCDAEGNVSPLGGLNRNLEGDSRAPAKEEGAE